MSSDRAPTEARADSTVARRERLRFTGFTMTRSPSGLVTAEVSLEWAPGETVMGRAQGQASPAGDAESMRRVLSVPAQAVAARG